MNYSKIYSDLIESAKLRLDIPLLNGYLEKHHIVPRSMGGSNDKDNIVSLTAREHFIAHWLLWRIHRNSEMACAFILMSANGSGKRYYNSRGFEAARKAMSEARKGKILSNETKEKLRNINLGKRYLPRSEETRKKISEARKGKTLSKETRKKLSQREFSPEWKEKLSKAAKKRKRIPHSEECRKKIGEANKKRVISEETRRKIGEASRLRALKKREAKNQLSPL